MTRFMDSAVMKSAAVAGLVCLASVGCNKKTDNTSNFKSAIDTYYSARPVCLWNASKQLPVQADADDKSKTSDYDSLVDQGLLTRTTVEKKKLIVMTKQANNYDLSDKGRSAWTADQSQPGYGNFCYGHRKVASITSASPTTSDVGATSNVVYLYAIDGAPDWAKAAETQTAFPQVKADLDGQQTAQATLTNTSNGWQLTSAPGSTRTSGSAPATAADGQVVH